jgi:uncharacterized protein YecT (DUF1311 family)
MRKLTLVLAMFSCHLCFAASDEQVVKAMSKTTRLTADEIRADYNACDSGVTIRIKICLNYDLTEQDRRLNSLYKKVGAKAKEEVFEKSLPASVTAGSAIVSRNQLPTPGRRI